MAKEYGKYTDKHQDKRAGSWSDIQIPALLFAELLEEVHGLIFYGCTILY